VEAVRFLPASLDFTFPYHLSDAAKEGCAAEFRRSALRTIGRARPAAAFLAVGIALLDVSATGAKSNTINFRMAPPILSDIARLPTYD
jgi:hypothetical protein